MQAEQIKLVQSTIPVLREHGVALTQYFYQRMLTNHPELKNLFNMEHQQSGQQPRALAAAVLAYAENIEHPEKLSKALARITSKHVSLGIQAAQYQIVGENLLHSISEVLNVPMQSELIAAWKAAYLQLADMMIQAEQAQYAALEATVGGWSGWRNFRITARKLNNAEVLLLLSPEDGQAIAITSAPAYISVRVALHDQNYKQAKQYSLQANSNASQYAITLAVPAQDQVSQILSDENMVGTTVEVSAPLLS